MKSPKLSEIILNTSKPFWIFLNQQKTFFYLLYFSWNLLNYSGTLKRDL